MSAMATCQFTQSFCLHSAILHLASYISDLRMDNSVIQSLQIELLLVPKSFAALKNCCLSQNYLSF